MQEVLARGYAQCPNAEVLWLMAAKEKWLGGDIPGAQAILAEAFKANEDSESIFLAAAKLASETGEMEAAMQILEKAKAQADTDRVRLIFPACPADPFAGGGQQRPLAPSLCLSETVKRALLTLQIWMKSAVLQRQLGRLDDALSTLSTAIAKYPTFAKLHMIRGQILSSQNKIPEARAAFAQGCRSCPKSIPLWILSARLEEQAGVTIKARSLLEKGRLHNPKNDELWVESIQIEERAGGTQQAKSLLARGTSIHSMCRRQLQVGCYEAQAGRQRHRGAAAEASVADNNSPTRMPHFPSHLVHGHLYGSPSTAQRPFGRCAQKGRRTPGRHYRRRASFLE